jgi:tetratricopeptide (TPR) repeat protein
MDEASRNRYLKDVEYFSKKLEEDPTSRLFMPLAFAYLKLGKYDEVIDICSKGLDYHPDYIAAKVVLANAFMEKGMVEEAKLLLYDVVEKMPDNYRANKMLGDILRESGDILSATIYYRTALITSPEDFELKVLIEELSESLGNKIFTDNTDLKQIDETIEKAETAPVDADMSDLRSEIGKMDEIFSGAYADEDMKKQSIVEIPEEAIPEEPITTDKIDLNFELQGDDKENLATNNIDFGKLDLEDSFKESADKKEDVYANIEKEVLEKIDFGDVQLDDNTKPYENIQSFDSYAESMLYDMNTDKVALVLEEKEEKDVGVTLNELDLSLLDDLEKKPVLDEKELSFPDSSETLDRLDHEKLAQSLALDITDAELSDKAKHENLIEQKNLEIINELERWLSNVRRLKDDRNAK